MTKKSALGSCQPGTPEYVIRHAALRHSRGRRPNCHLVIERPASRVVIHNPRIALKRAQEMLAPDHGKPAFAILEERVRVTAEQVVATLEKYAESGCAISGPVVVTLLKRVRRQMAPDQYLRTRNAALVGITYQERLAQGKVLPYGPTDADQYRQVLSWVLTM